MFISFEGIDGCGKSTQLKLLADHLEGAGRDVLCIREPGGTGFSETIREMLLSNKNLINPRAELMLFEAARSHLVDTIIIPALKSGKIVLTDRFYDSTTAYQGYGRMLPLDEVKNCNEFATFGAKPDMTIYLDLPLDEAKQRAKHRENDRIESSGNDFFRRVIDGFRKIADEESERVKMIDAAGTIEETHEKIVDLVNELLTGAGRQK